MQKLLFTLVQKNDAIKIKFYPQNIASILKTNTAQRLKISFHNMTVYDSNESNWSVYAQTTEMSVETWTPCWLNSHL